MNKRVQTKRIQFTICTYKELIEQFKKQSYKLSKSMSRRIEDFMINELEKEKKNEH